MTYIVRTPDDLFAVGSEGLEGEHAASAPLFERGLNSLERQGWTLVTVAGQHRQWGREGDDETMGGLYGPYFVFHKDDGAVESSHLR